MLSALPVGLGADVPAGHLEYESVVVARGVEHEPDEISEVAR